MQNYSILLKKPSVLSFVLSGCYYAFLPAVLLAVTRGGDVVNGVY